MDEKDVMKIRSCGLILAMYEEGYDPVECFVPIVVFFTPDYDYTDAIEIQHDLESVIDLPVLTVQKILERAVHKGLLTIKENKEMILYKAIKNKMDNYIESFKDIRKQIDEMCDDLQNYFRDHSFLPAQPVLKVCEDFLDALGLDIAFILPGQEIKKIQEHFFENVNQTIGCNKIVQYLRDPDTLPVHIHTFQNVLMGFILKESLREGDLEIVKIDNYKDCMIFLDTNFIISLLGGHTEQINRPIQEMYEKLLSYFNFKIKVFDFTVEQLKHVLPTFAKGKRNYIKGSKLGDKLENEGVKAYLEGQFYKDLGEKNVEIYCTNNVLGNSGTTENKEMLEFTKLYTNLLKQYKFLSDSYGRQHDLAAIKMIRDIRKEKQATASNLRAVFLTSDRLLREFYEIEIANKNRKEIVIGEVLLDFSFTFFLWFLKKEMPAIDLEMTIAAFSRNLFTSVKVLEKYNQVRSQLMKQGFNIQDISPVVQLRIHNILREFTDDEIEKVTPDFVAKIREEGINDRTECLEGQLEILRQTYENLKNSNNTKDEELKKLILDLEKSRKKEKKEALFNKILVSLLVALFLFNIVYYGIKLYSSG